MSPSSPFVELHCDCGAAPSAVYGGAGVSAAICPACARLVIWDGLSGMTKTLDVLDAADRRPEATDRGSPAEEPDHTA